MENSLLKVIIIAIFSFILFGTLMDYFYVNSNIKFSIDCKDHGMTYQKIDNIWICR